MTDGQTHFPRGASLARIRKVLQAPKECIFFNDHARIRTRLVPMALPVREIPKFIYVRGPSTTYVSNVRVADRWLQMHQECSIRSIIEGASIQELRLAYLIDLRINVISSQGSHIVNYQISRPD